MAKQKKSVKQSKHDAGKAGADWKPYIEADIAEAQKVHELTTELSGPLSMPFRTKEGLVLIALAIILVAINNNYTRYLGWAALLAAFFVPLIKKKVLHRR